MPHTDEQIFAKLKTIFGATLGLDDEEVYRDARLRDDLGADLLEDVELIMAIEEEFGLEIPEEDAARIWSVAQLIEYLMEREEE